MQLLFAMFFVGGWDWWLSPFKADPSILFPISDSYRRCLDHQPAQCYTLLITPPTSWVNIFSQRSQSWFFMKGCSVCFCLFLCRRGRRLAQWSKRVFAAGLGERNLCGVTCNCNKQAWHVYFIIINTCFKARFVISDHVLYCSDGRWRFAGKGLKKYLKWF